MELEFLLTPKYYVNNKKVDASSNGFNYTCPTYELQ